MLELLLSYFAVSSFVGGSFLWLVKTIHKATVYLKKIEHRLEELNDSIKALERKDSHFDSRITDIEQYLSKSTEFVIRRY